MTNIAMYKWVVAVGLVSVAVAALVVLRARPPSDLTPSHVVAQSQVAEEQVLAQLGEGKVLHMRDVIYRRHGPATSLIRNMSTEWYLPERHVQELWLEVGAGGRIVAVRGSVESERGELLQETMTAGSEVITRDVASGAEFRVPLHLSVEDLAERMRMSRGLTEEKLADGTVAVIGEGQLGDQFTLMLEESIPGPPSITNVDGAHTEGFSIPYVEDIEPATWLRRTEVGKESFLALRWSVVVVDKTGLETVVEEKQRNVFEVVDESSGGGT